MLLPQSSKFFSFFRLIVNIDLRISATKNAHQFLTPSLVFKLCDCRYHRLSSKFLFLIIFEFLQKLRWTIHFRWLNQALFLSSSKAFVNVALTLFPFQNWLPQLRLLLFVVLSVDSNLKKSLFSLIDWILAQELTICSEVILTNGRKLHLNNLGVNGSGPFQTLQIKFVFWRQYLVLVFDVFIIGLQLLGWIGAAQ